MAKFKVGDRVRAVRDKPMHNISRGDVHTIDSIDSAGDLWFRDNPLCGSDCCSQPGNFELVTNSKGATIVSERRTFKQLKDSMEVKKGALFQEKCDDGGQEYVLLDWEQYTKHIESNQAHGFDQKSLARDEVEQEPDWFVEVFKVHPEYLEKGEIEAWEHFRKTYKKPATKTKVSKHVPRLVEVVDMHNIGMTNKAIARKLKIRPESVYTYLWKARKTGLLG